VLWPCVRYEAASTGQIMVANPIRQIKALMQRIVL
jgi:hypothetical protein